MPHSHRRQPVCLQVEELESRLVPSGTALDLTTRGAAGVIGDAVFRQGADRASSSVRTFVRLDTHRHAATEQGYNTDARPLQFDEARGRGVTHALRVRDVPAVSVDGVPYREFLLDINQKNSAPRLSLDELRVYVGDAANLKQYDGVSKQLAGLAAVYDLDADGNHWVKLNARLGNGSRAGDMTLLLPESVLGTDPGKFVYLYSAFGHHAAANGGFEAWAVRKVKHKPPDPCDPPPPPPPPAALASLAGSVFHDANQDGVFGAEDFGIGGATVTLSGVNDLGENVSLVATTGDDGSYQFANLRPGTYVIEETQPLGFWDGNDTIGTQGGQTANDRFFNITLAAGVNGQQNNFGEVLFE